MGQRVAQRADGVQQRRSKEVLNGSWTHSVHFESLSVPEASEEAVTATVQAGVLKACVQRGPDRLVQQVRGHERARRLIS